MNKIYKKNDKLIIEIPFKIKRCNVWDEEDFNEDMDHIVGVIAGDELGFAYFIDMAYKGKGDQITDFFYSYHGEEKAFVKLCKKLDIYVHKYCVCSECGKVLYGAFTLGDNGEKCLNCK